MTETTEAPRRNPSPCPGTPRLNSITRTGASRRNPSRCKRTPCRKQTLRTEESALMPSCDMTGYKSMESTRTSSSSTAGREARIQTGALPAVGWSALFAFLIPESCSGRILHEFVDLAPGLRHKKLKKANCCMHGIDFHFLCQFGSVGNLPANFYILVE